MRHHLAVLGLLLSCTPDDVTPPPALGEACDPSGEGCKDGLWCAAPTADDIGVCQTACESNADCPVLEPGILTFCADSAPYSSFPTCQFGCSDLVRCPQTLSVEYLCEHGPICEARP